MLRFNVDGLRKSNTRYLIVKNILLSLVYTLEKNLYTCVLSSGTKCQYKIERNTIYSKGS